MNYKYDFTVFTPCYNSERFIHRVYNSLVAQSHKNFEWLVINDGSTDNTSAIISKYKNTAPFDIQFFDLKENQMLTKNYNLAIRNAKGQFFIPIGHDDEIEPHALETFLCYWEKYGSPKLSGVSCLCNDQEGNLVGDKYPDSPYFSNYFDVDQNISGEKWGFYRTEIIKEYLLPEDVDTYILESLMWMAIAKDYDRVFINESLRIYYINQSNVNNLSNINKKKLHYINGARYYSLQVINYYMPYIRSNMKSKVLYFLNYLRMSIHMRYPFVKILTDIKGFRKRVVSFLLLPFGYLIIIRDNIIGKV